jgi:ankyrin repeat protein
MSTSAKLDANDWTPLHVAVAANAPEAVRALIRARADVNAVDKAGRSPRAIMQMLLDPTQYGPMNAALSERP